VSIRRLAAHAGAAFILFSTPSCGENASSVAASAPPAPPLATDAAEPPPLSPEDEAKSFVLSDPTLEVRLAAAEPLIEAPVAAAFDEHGALWVIEMRTYMRDAVGTGELAPDNRVRVLHDDDGDGVFDRATTFLDGLVLPRAIAPCFGGALVLEPPTLYFCRDTDGDGRADEKRALRDGFGGRDAPEHAANGLLYGVDNRYEFSQHPLRFRFDGKAATFEPASGHGQWGLTQDENGRLYYTPNSAALLYDFYSRSYAGRRRRGGPTPGLGAAASSDHRVRPLTRSPVNRGYLPGVLDQEGRLASLTAACSPLWLATDGLGAALRGSVLVCEPAGNLVQRYSVVERDGAPRAAPETPELPFLASRDPRFRPVHLCTTPTGDVLVVDMYRGLLQHRLYLTPYLREKTEASQLVQPLAAGRLWRIVRRGAPPRPKPRFDAADPLALAAALKSPEDYERATAQRLLVERRDPRAATPVREVFRTAPHAASAIRALWTLDALGAATDEDVLAACDHSRPPVRVQGLRLAESRPDRPALVARMIALAQDDDRRVRVQAVLALGARAATTEGRAELLRVLARHGDDPILRGAALTALEDRELAILGELRADGAEHAPLTAETRAFAVDVVDQALRAGPRGAAALADFAAGALSADRATAELVLERFAAKQKLDAPEPRPLEVAVEPKRLVAAVAALPADAKRARWERLLAWCDWPGRPPADRPASARPLTATERERFARGEELFVRCAACHGATGEGVGGLGPSLAASTRPDGSPEKLVLILLFGIEGEFTLGGATYRGSMPKAEVAGDAEIAALATFVRRSFGHVQEPVEPAFVAAVRAAHAGRTKPWTAAELDALPSAPAAR
jgi:mono/diheme cytochrome c family protein